MASIESLTSEFKNHIKMNLGLDLDFRTHCYIPNSNGLGPTFPHKTAFKVVSLLHKWAQNKIDAEKNKYPNFAGWACNLNQSTDELKNQTLKSVINEFCSDLVYRRVEPFRYSNDAIYKYDHESESYLFYSKK